MSHPSKKSGPAVHDARNPQRTIDMLAASIWAWVDEVKPDREPYELRAWQTYAGGLELELFYVPGEYPDHAVRVGHGDSVAWLRGRLRVMPRQYMEDPSASTTVTYDGLNAAVIVHEARAVVERTSPSTLLICNLIDATPCLTFVRDMGHPSRRQTAHPLIPGARVTFTANAILIDDRVIFPERPTNGTS